MSSKTRVICDDISVEDVIKSNYWKSVCPVLDEIYAAAHSVPSQIGRGLFRGYSMPIWATPATQYEELLFRMRVPFSWDGVTKPWFVAITTPLAEETINDRYQFQLEWEAADIGGVLPDTTAETLTSEVTLITGENAAYYAHIIAFELTATTLVSGQNLQLRVRRIAATQDEVANEPALYHWDSRWKMETIGSASDMGY